MKAPYVALLLVATATFLTSLSYVIMKRAHMKAVIARKSFMKLFVWWVGFTFLGLSQLVGLSK